MNLLERVVLMLSAEGIAHALIGAGALAVHGVSRSTFDQDLLVRDARVLDRQFWIGLEADASVDIRRGDADDPLTGVVRASRDGDRDVDVVVGRNRWQDDILARATAVGGQQMRVVEPADLILLKLYAGGSQDRWDIEQLLAVAPQDTLSLVDARVGVLPLRSRDLWTVLRAPH